MANPDLSSVAAFEKACQEFGIPATRASAERTLYRLSTCPEAIQIAFYVSLKTSSELARCHAAVILRKCAITHWSTLSTQQRHGQTSIRFHIVNNVMSHPSYSVPERKSLLRTAAFLTQRAYLEEPQHLVDNFFSLLCETVASSSPQVSHSATAACEFVEFLAEEFMAPTLPSSATVTQWEIFLHARARFSQPRGHLVQLLHASIAALSIAVSAHSNCLLTDAQFEERALPALSTIFRVLATDFTQLQGNPTAKAPLDLYADAEGGNSDSEGGDGERLEVVVINAFARPGWADVVEQLPNVLSLCFVITASHTTSNGNDSELIGEATQIVIAISAVCEASYGSELVARRMLTSLLDGINQQAWSVSPMVKVRLAYAEIWRRISCAHEWASVESLPFSYLEAFTKHTCQELDAVAGRLANPDEDDDVFSMDVADMLIETWANLALQSDDGMPSTEHPLADQLGQVIVYFTRMNLRSSGEHTAKFIAIAQSDDLEEDLGFEDKSIEEERLNSAGIITRFVVEKVAPAISQSLLQTADKVFRWDGMKNAGNVPLALYQEDLFFLVRFAAAVLADVPKGEHPTVPIQFISEQNNGKLPKGHEIPIHHAQVLLSALFDVAQGETRLLERRGPNCEEGSPRVGAAILDALNRIAKTYLVPVNMKTVLLTFEAIGGIAWLKYGRNICFIKALEGISLRGTESDIAEGAGTLLYTMATGASDYTDVKECPAWETLLRAGSRAYQTLPAEAVVQIGKSLTLVLGDVVAEGLLLPAYNALHVLTEERERVADAADRAIATMNLLRGAAQCSHTGPRTLEALLLAIKAPDGKAATCARAFGKIRPDVGRALVMLANDLVSTSLPVLFDKQSSRDLLANAITIVRMQAEIVSNFLAGGDTPVDELVEDIEQIISLLSDILDDGAADSDVAEASFYGLSTLFPLITNSALEFPNIGSLFFRLTARLVALHPKKLIMLPADFCGRILQTLDLQRQSVDNITEMRTLEAITVLARTRVIERVDGPSSGIVNAALLTFLKSIFKGLADGSAHTTNLDAAANALLPLFHVSYDGVGSVFEELGQALLRESWNNVDMRTAIQELGHAASQAGSAFGFNLSKAQRETIPENIIAQRQASKSFREAVARFSARARKCLLSIAVHSVSIPISKGY